MLWFNCFWRSALNNIAQNIIEAKRLLTKLENLTACPTNMDKFEVLKTTVALEKAVKALNEG